MSEGSGDRGLFAARTHRLTASRIISVAERTRALRAEGREVIDLADGEPDFDTPPNVIAAAQEAMRRGETRYTPVAGTARLKAAVRDKFCRDNGLEFEDEEILVTPGSKFAVFAAFMASVEPGDEVIIPTPCWSTYIDLVTFFGGTPVLVPCDPKADFKLTTQQLEGALSPNTKWLILNGPCNPTGAVYGEDDLTALAAELLKHPRVHVLSDDIYEHIIFDGRRFRTMAAVEPRLRERVLTVNGVSKAYAMTGWRIGYAGGPVPLIDTMRDLQSQSLSNATSVSQAAAAEALSGPQAIVGERCAAYQARRDRLVSRLSDLGGFEPFVPRGAFFAYTSCAGLLGRTPPGGEKLASDTDVAEYLVTGAGVATIPGTAFGFGGYLRLCFARPEELLDAALDRIAAACAQLA